MTRNCGKNQESFERRMEFVLKRLRRFAVITAAVNRVQGFEDACNEQRRTSQRRSDLSEPEKLYRLTSLFKLERSHEVREPKSGTPFKILYFLNYQFTQIVTRRVPDSPDLLRAQVASEHASLRSRTQVLDADRALHNDDAPKNLLDKIKNQTFSLLASWFVGLDSDDARGRDKWRWGQETEEGSALIGASRRVKGLHSLDWGCVRFVHRFCGTFRSASCQRKQRRSLSLAATQRIQAIIKYTSYYLHIYLAMSLCRRIFLFALFLEAFPSCQLKQRRRGCQGLPHGNGR